MRKWALHMCRLRLWRDFWTDTHILPIMRKAPKVEV